MLRVDIESHTCKSQEDHLGNFPFPPAVDVLAGADSVLKDVLHEAIDLSIGNALTDGIDNDDRNWSAGYAQAMKDTIATLNRDRKI